MDDAVTVGIFFAAVDLFVQLHHAFDGIVTDAVDHGLHSMFLSYLHQGFDVFVGVGFHTVVIRIIGVTVSHHGGTGT